MWLKFRLYLLKVTIDGEWSGTPSFRVIIVIFKISAGKHLDCKKSSSWLFFLFYLISLMLSSHVLLVLSLVYQVLPSHSYTEIVGGSVSVLEEKNLAVSVCSLTLKVHPLSALSQRGIQYFTMQQKSFLVSSFPSLTHPIKSACFWCKEMRTNNRSKSCLSFPTPKKHFRNIILFAPNVTLDTMHSNKCCSSDNF